MKRILVCILTFLFVFNISSAALVKNNKIVKKHRTAKSTSVSKKVVKNKVKKTAIVLKSNKILKINSEAAILMDLNSGKILYSKNMHEKLYPASTTKILTAIIAIESGSLDRIVTIGVNPPLVEPTKIGLKKGEKIRLRDLMYALLVDSANDSAVAIAEYIGGTEANFAKMMNNKARLLGCKDSHFVNPNGLNNNKHLTSAYDLAIITKYAMRNSTFRKMVSTKFYTIPATNKSKAISLTNHNKMILKSTSYYYPGCIGVKTGYTIASRHTLVSAAVRGNKRLLAVILKDQEVPYNDITRMLDYGFGK